MKKIIAVSLLLISYMGFSQSSGVGINPTGVTPDPSAMLDVSATDKGFLMPRLTTLQRDGIQTPAVGLLIYNTTENCLQVYMPISGWRNTVCDCQMSPSASYFTFPDSSALNGNVVFNASTSGMNYSWTFQSGTPSTSTQQSPTVVWVNAGTYTVSLTVSDNTGCNTTTTDSITIINCPPPVALNFTNCSQTGQTGPSQGQCNSEYGGTSLDGLVTVNAGIQEWTVPFTGTYNFQVAGARGGASNNGSGVIIYSDIILTQGDVLSILVGQRGAHGQEFGGCGSSSAGGGGGGSFVYNQTHSSLIFVAAGGGGGGSDGSGINGQTGTSGTSGNGGAGGTGGVNGGGGGGGSGYGGGGGGGFCGNGGNSAVGYNTGGNGGNGCNNGTDGVGTVCNTTKGVSFLNGGKGGASNSNCHGAGCGSLGGFGGGGGSMNGNLLGGGGGGYSGGGGGGYSSSIQQHLGGGGGGSYIDANATNISTSNGQYDGSGTFNGNSITNLSSYNLGDGYVTISLVCP